MAIERQERSKVIRNYKDLIVWQEAMTLVEMTYRLVRELPVSEKYGTSSQMTRAAVSVPANVAEGHASGHRKVFVKYLTISRGSLVELETYLALIVRLGLVSVNRVEPARGQLEKVARLLNALIRALRKPKQQD